MNEGSLKDQLLQFSRAFQKASRSPLPVTPPGNWVAAFAALEQLLERLDKRKKWVVFFDEFPWLNSRKSGFLSAFDHFWNTWASRQSYLIMVICGSAASWMIDNIVNAKRGLHNRITRSIKLLPFSLPETKAYLQHLSVTMDHYQILQLYMALGGVPHYLRNVRRGQSATKAINSICFTKTSVLRNEFDNLYKSLFEHAENHLKIVRALSKVAKGLTRQEIIDACGCNSGGGTTDILYELEQSGFIQSAIPYKKTSRDAIYRLIDEFSLFYLRFMDEVKITGRDMWSRISQTNAYKIWSGMSFEAICLKHVFEIKMALGIGGDHSEEGPWRYSSQGSGGAQIDLLIDRTDHTINICEMKFYNDEFAIDKTYALELDRKLRVFREQTRTKKTLLLSFITTYGVRLNDYSKRLVHHNLTMDLLFKEYSFEHMA